MSTKITTATLTNFQKVSFAKIEPSGNLIVLAGKNGAGKTSTNDGLEAGMCGHNGRNIKRPIKDGHGKASIDIKLSDGSTLIRGYTPSGTTLKGVDAAGNKFGQKEIDARLSSLGIDGRKFISMGERDQLKALLSIVDLPFNPAELDAERKRVFDERTEANRYAKRLEAQLQAFPDSPEDLPTEEASVSALNAEYRAGVELNNKIFDANAAAKSWTERVAALRAELEEAQNQLDNASDYSAKAPAPVDLEAIQSRIDSAQDTNAMVRSARERAAVAKNLEATQRESLGLIDELVAIDKRKADGLAAAEMPIEGLTFDDEGVLYQGVPFSRASGREQLIVSCAMIMATDPEIRVIVIRDGNVLDMEGMQILQDMAEATDFQIFIEIVAEDAGDHEYFFVDGELAS